MVVKRRRSSPATQEAKPDVDLMEQLVKKSLEVNPQLRDGKSTREVLAGLREEAVSRSKSHGQEPEAPQPSLSERRSGTIAFFLEQKAKEFHESERDIIEREMRLRAERTNLQRRVIDEIEVFLALVSDGKDSPEARAILTRSRTFLQQLGTNEKQLLAASRRRS
jgi:hypothetical protein